MIQATGVPNRVRAGAESRDWTLTVTEADARVLTVTLYINICSPDISRQAK